MSLAEVAPVVLTGAATALFGADANNNAIEIPMSRTEIKKASEKTDVTGSTSVWAGEVWREFGKGVSSGSISWEAHWRVGQIVAPPMLKQGRTYYLAAYIRRPFWNGILDVGSAYRGNVIINDNSLTLDPKSGDLAWRVSGDFNGPILDPT